jgi:hypothetical protein
MLYAPCIKVHPKLYQDEENIWIISKATLIYVTHVLLSSLKINIIDFTL